jgi:serine phosphatase RsbU (regulator of sigma subunit)
VTEAMNVRNQLYTEGRLEAVLNRLPVLAAESVCRAVLEDLALFVGTNEQSDDITMLALHYQGSAKKA